MRDQSWISQEELLWKGFMNPPRIYKPRRGDKSRHVYNEQMTAYYKALELRELAAWRAYRSFIAHSPS